MPSVSHTISPTLTAAGSVQRWVALPEEELLEWKICDLQLDFEATSLPSLREKLYAELESNQIGVQPHIWLSDDWFSPDGVAGIAVPFYLAHPRLTRLERKMKWEVEGGTRKWCLQILRHEAGHAIDTAFELHRKKAYRETFGNYYRQYPEFYSPDPRSKDFVHHLDPWYAQSHPSEDFAETFAVWLTPNSRWQTQYVGWKAMDKLRCVDKLMKEIAGQKPRKLSRRKIDPVHRLGRTLRQHYVEQLNRYELDEPSIFDPQLKEIFSIEPDTKRCRSAAAFLEKNRTELIQATAAQTGDLRYNVHQVVRELISRCKAMKLHAAGDESDLTTQLKTILPEFTTHFLDQRHRLAL